MQSVRHGDFPLRWMLWQTRDTEMSAACRRLIRACAMQTAAWRPRRWLCWAQWQTSSTASCSRIWKRSGPCCGPQKVLISIYRPCPNPTPILTASRKGGGRI